LECLQLKKFNYQISLSLLSYITSIMNQKTHISLIIVFLFMGMGQRNLHAQNTEVDSLNTLITNTTNDTAKINLLIDLSQEKSWSDINLSEQFAKQALLLSEQNNYIKGLAYSKFILSKAFIHFDFSLSEELLLESLKHAKYLKDSLLIARIYIVAGILKSNSDENDDALLYYKKSLKILQNHNQDSLMAGVYNNMGIVYKNILNDSLSSIYYLKAAEINKRTKNYLWLSFNYLNMGNDLLDADNPNKAYSYLIKSLNLAKINNFYRLLPWVYNNISFYYYKKTEISESIKYANLALEIAKNQLNRMQEREALKQLKEAYLETGDFQNAFKYLEQINTVTDSINTHNKLKELDLLEMRYKFDEERKAQKLESALLEAKHYKTERNYIIIILGAGIILFTIVFLYIIQHNRIRRKSMEQKATLLEKEKLSQKLEFKNKELTTNVIYLLKKNEFISEISNKLKNTDLNLNEANSNVIDRIITELDRSISEDNWTEFEIRFQEVHIDFYNRLSKKHPDLTPNELRLCAFLRLNMTTKEIADITYQSLESLRTARYRLRKKLGMEREDNLVAFLTKL